ncbi:MAG TPA: DUF1036 domain-containing protein [Pyrinomonadaceae bacterium]|nr:DUF1036 domain-containing protein [Pyrinomonadaceae bacterium]
MKNLSIKILFLCVFISIISAIANAQILFDPPKEWANSVPQLVIDASPAPVMSGKPLRIGSCKKNELCTEQADASFSLEVYVAESPNSTKDSWVSETPDFSVKNETEIENTIRFLIRSHQWQKALEAANKVIPKWYSSSIAYVNRAIIFYAIGQTDCALKDLEAALYWANGQNSSSGYVLAHLQRGIILVQRGDAEKAKADYDVYAAIPAYFWTYQSLARGKDALRESIARNSVSNSSNSSKLAFADKILDGSLPNCDSDPKVLEFSAKKYHRKYESLLFLTKSAFQCKNLSKAYEYANQFIEFTRAEQKADNTLLNRRKVKIAYAVRRDIYESEGKFKEAVYDALEAYKIVSNRFDGSIILNDEEYDGAETVLIQLSKVKNGNPFSLEEMSMFLALKNSFQATQKKKADENDAKLAQLANDKVGSFRLCNQMGEPLKVAVSYPDKDVAGRYSDGWRWLKNGECTSYITVNIADIPIIGKPKYAAYANEIEPRPISGMNESTCLPKMNAYSGHRSIPFSCSGDFDSFPAESINVQANKILTININLQR